MVSEIIQAVAPSYDPSDVLQVDFTARQIDGTQPFVWTRSVDDPAEAIQTLDLIPPHHKMTRHISRDRAEVALAVDGDRSSVLIINRSGYISVLVSSSDRELAGRIGGSILENIPKKRRKV